MDLKLLKFDENVTFNYVDVARLQSASAQDTSVSALEVITNKVVKFLLTEKGTDIFDPSYGSNWVKSTQVADVYLSRLRVEIDRDIWRCVEFISNVEKSLPVTREKLRNVEFLGFVKDTTSGIPEILIKIRIYTTFGNVATFNIGR